MASTHDKNRTRHYLDVIDHGPGSIRARYNCINTTLAPYDSHFPIPNIFRIHARDARTSLTDHTTR